MTKREQQIYLSTKGHVSFLKSIKRKKRVRLRKAGYSKHRSNMKANAFSMGRKYSPPRQRLWRNVKRPNKPEYSDRIKYLLSLPQVFSNLTLGRSRDGKLMIPKCFSLIENSEESFDFLKKLFLTLYQDNINKVYLDYSNCERIDVDASICMDIILAEFINYYSRCQSLDYREEHNIKSIEPINFDNKENIKKVLFSIGAYRNLKGFKINYPDIEDLPVIINNHENKNVWGKSEVDLTNIVEYIKKCLKRLNRQLTPEAENEFYKVIGEIQSNALEHSTMPLSYAIGFFQETHNDSEHFGVFNFSIINLGNTIYQTFKNEDCPNKKAVSEMNNLSESFTKKGFFSRASFEEETLWTLYALQEGITSKEKKRGNGSIQYIENFFKLKGDMNKDNISSMVIVSGNARIIFDGTYKIIQKAKEGTKKQYKYITFNDSGEINEEPNKKFVKFAPNFFPGTMISARILIKFDNTDNSTNGN